MPKNKKSQKKVKINSSEQILENKQIPEDPFHYFVGACYGHTDKWANGESVPEKYRAVGKFLASNKDTLATLDIEAIFGPQSRLTKEFKNFINRNDFYPSQPWSNYNEFVKACNNAKSANEKIKVYSHLTLELSGFAKYYTQEIYQHITSIGFNIDNQIEEPREYKKLMNQANAEYEATQAEAEQAKLIAEFLAELEATNIAHSLQTTNATKQQEESKVDQEESKKEEAAVTKAKANLDCALIPRQNVTINKKKALEKQKKEAYEITNYACTQFGPLNYYLALNQLDSKFFPLPKETEKAHAGDNSEISLQYLQDLIVAKPELLAYSISLLKETLVNFELGCIMQQQK